jgi:acetyl-CoA carboxylase carboxyltransferase component
MAFNLFGALSGLVPLVGINSGRCFAGNAALLGCCDVVIATADSSIGMGGPAMIEGGGLGVFHPDEVGPMSVQVPNGVVDVAVDDEAEAVAVARQYLSFFQGPVSDWDCADQRLLRFAIPENRLRVYDIRNVIETMADTGSVLELRRDFGLGMITALIRIEGRPLGLIANNPMHLAGAITSDGADKAARFMQLCDAFDIPILFLCDTPGMMVGPEAEQEGIIRAGARFVEAMATARVPKLVLTVNHASGAGYYAMAGQGFDPDFIFSWPTGRMAVMEGEAAIQAVHGPAIESAKAKGQPVPKATSDSITEMRADYEHQLDARYAGARGFIDAIVYPEDTRDVLVLALRASLQNPGPHLGPFVLPAHVDDV